MSRKYWAALVPCLVCACGAQTAGDISEGGAVEASRLGLTDESEVLETDVPEVVMTVSEPQEVASDGTCPANMVLVHGKYCPDAMHICKRWLDPPGRFHEYRCAEYAASVCKSKVRKELRFCIDRDEYTAPGDTVPTVNYSWSGARKTCEQMGKRMCLESEWQFACEGEDMHPYPYGDGFTRDVTACNIDRMGIMGKTAPVDFREAAGSHPRCLSPFGVRDMSGNIEEWAWIDGATVRGYRSTMKGSWWMPGKNHCRARTTAHGEIYSGPQIGVRCCSAPKN